MKYIVMCRRTCNAKTWSYCPQKYAGCRFDLISGPKRRIGRSLAGGFAQDEAT
jgi:hypothetical protein